MSAIDALDAQLIEKFNKDYTASGLQIKQGLEELSNSNISTIPEPIFVRDFLPMFSGEVPQNMDLLSMWYLISNGPFEPVNVVTNAGKFVIRIPPFKYRDALPVWEKEETINGILMENESLKAISPRAAQNAFAGQLDQRYFGEGNTFETNASTIQEEWKKVMIHYGKLKDNKIAVNLASSQDDEIEYE
jgi:hypothetical protein